MIEINFPTKYGSISMKNFLKFAIMFKDTELNHFQTMLLTFDRSEMPSVDFAWAVCRSIVQHLNYRHKTSYRLRRDKKHIYFYIDFYAPGASDKKPFSNAEFLAFLKHIRKVCNYCNLDDNIKVQGIESGKSCD